jgi:hypothetical protein
MVWFSPDEGRVMAARLGLTEAVFLARHARRIGSRWSLREVHTAYGYDCVFLDRTSGGHGKAQCSIYEARPTQCRTWPFWPENLDSERSWRTVKKRTPCPGMDNGRLVPVEEIRILRDQDRHCEKQEAGTSAE